MKTSSTISLRIARFRFFIAVSSSGAIGLVLFYLSFGHVVRYHESNFYFHFLILSAVLNSLIIHASLRRGLWFGVIAVFGLFILSHAVLMLGMGVH
jgi:hypothetical protein